MNLSSKIDTVKNISTQHFKEKYLEKQTPVIIKGLADDTVAGKKWSLNYFRDNLGELMIDVFDNSNKKLDASATTSSDFKMKFKDYIDVISTNEPTDLRIFLYNMFKHYPQLRKEFPCPEIFKGILDKKAFMFFGGKDTTVRIHYDIDMSNVLHSHFGGRKKILLIAPEYSEMLHCLPLNTYSLVDPAKPDYVKYPALKNINATEVILESGDSLFIPSGYWHHITYLEGSFSVSYRKISSNYKNTLEGIKNLIIYLPLDKLLNKILGKFWLKTKINIADKKANRAVHKKNITDFSEILGI